MNPLPSVRHNQTLDTATAFVREVVVSVFRGDDQEAVVRPEVGSFTQDGRRAMRWSGSMSLPAENLLPRFPTDLLTPFGTRVEVELGIKLMDGTVSTIPWGTYVVSQSRAGIQPNAQQVTLPLIDLADVVAGYRFESPFTIPGGVDLGEAVELVIGDRTGATPDLPVTGRTLAKKRVFGLDPEEDPWRELQDLVAGFGFQLFYDRSGDLQLIPTPIPDPNTAVHIVGPSSVDIAFETRPPNVVVARGEPPDGQPPVQGIALDDDPLSPTYAGPGPGTTPYGRITRYFASPLLSTVDQAQAAAETVLARVKGAGASWEVTRPFDPRFDPTDAVVLTIDNSAVPLQVDAVTVDISQGTVIVARDLTGTPGFGPDSPGSP